MSLYCIVKMGNWARDLEFILFPLHLLLLNLNFHHFGYFSRHYNFYLAFRSRSRLTLSLISFNLPRGLFVAFALARHQKPKRPLTSVDFFLIWYISVRGTCVCSTLEDYRFAMRFFNPGLIGLCGLLCTGFPRVHGGATDFMSVRESLAKDYESEEAIPAEKYFRKYRQPFIVRL